MTVQWRVGDDSRGVALAVVLYALVTLSLLGSASFFLALQERRSAKSAIDIVLARASVEGSADSIVLHWNALTYNAIPVSDSLRVQVAPGGAQGASATLTRLGDSLFLVRVESSSGLARQQVSVIARLAPLTCPNGGAESTVASDSVKCYPTMSSSTLGRAVRLRDRGWIGGLQAT